MVVVVFYSLLRFCKSVNKVNFYSEKFVFPYYISIFYLVFK